MRVRISSGGAITPTETAKRRVINVTLGMDALTHKIGVALQQNGRYLLTLPAELAEFNGWSEEQIRNYALAHGWDVVLHMGGEQIEFFTFVSPPPAQPI